MQHAQGGAPGQFRVGVILEGFKAGFLCTTAYPCPTANGPVTTDSMSHTAATFMVDATLANIGLGTFDAYAATSFVIDSDPVANPSLMTTSGDTDLGIKVAAPVGDVMHLGLFSELWLIQGSGGVGNDGDATSARFGTIATAYLRGTPSHTPLRFSANVVYMLDNTAQTLAAAESFRGEPVTRIERYAFGANRVDHFDFYLGAEAMAADERFRPFVEAHILAPMNRQGYQCDTLNPSKDSCLKYDPFVQSTLSIGTRFFPWKRGISFLTALDIGLSGVKNFIEELQPVAPWTLYLGAGLNTDTQERPPVVREKIVDRTPARAIVIGFVHENGKREGIPNAIVSYRDRADIAPLATGPEGIFADEVPLGDFTYDVKAEGYKPGSCEANAAVAGEARIDCPLEALPRVGTVTGHVRDTDTSSPVATAPVVLNEPGRRPMQLNTDASGAFRFEGVSPGTATLTVQADGYLVQVSPAEVKVRQETTVEVPLRPKPKTANVVVTAKEISIKQQIQFGLDSAVILPDSFGLLTEIADTFIRHPEIRRVEVQGHTDNSGTPEHNKLLSEERAESVRAWLIAHGVPGDRLVAMGYGQEQPRVPNVTANMRAQNRRVQFIILDQVPAAPAP
jgi:outer membrane protein OmpA-like peptidoglycan-associated protein